MSPKLKFGLLVAVHVVGGLFLAWATANFRPAILMLFALLFAEAGLIGVWGGLSSTRLAWRLLAVIAATAYLWAVLILASQVVEKLWIFLIIALTALPNLVVLHFLRHTRRRLRMAHLVNESPLSEGFQFSIRHLLLAMAVVAVVLGIGRGVRTISNTHSLTVAVAICPACFVMIELATLWAALGIGLPIPRLAVIIPTAFIVGAVPVVYLPGPSDPSILQFLMWTTIIGLQAIITAASLLVVRSCGWRLVSGNRNEIESMPTPPGS